MGAGRGLLHFSVFLSLQLEEGLQKRLVGVHRNAGSSLIFECLRHAQTSCGVEPKPERLSQEPWQRGTWVLCRLSCIWGTELRDSFTESPLWMADKINSSFSSHVSVKESHIYTTALST